MLTGYDLSSHNTEAQFVSALGLDYVAIKASEGVSYKNPTHDGWAGRTRAAGKPVAHYHYARPETNGPEAEARWFVQCAGAQPGDIVVLDFEPPSIKATYPAWVLAWADTVRAALGGPQLLYINASQGAALIAAATDAQRLRLRALGLWKAWYNATIGDLMGWPDWIMWQYTATPIDANRFNGDLSRWRAWGLPGATSHVRTTWRGVATCSRMAAAADAACALLADGDQVLPTQGSYTTATAASGNTHAGCGALDISRFRRDGREWTWAELVTIANAFRRVGCYMWPRRELWNGTTLVWRQHAHGIMGGCPDLSSAARQQEGDYKASRDGLLPRGSDGLSINPDVPGCTRAYVSVTWESYLEENDMPTLEEVWGFKLPVRDDAGNVVTWTTPAELLLVNDRLNWQQVNSLKAQAGAIQALSDLAGKLSGGVDGVTADTIRQWVEDAVNAKVGVTLTPADAPRSLIGGLPAPLDVPTLLSLRAELGTDPDGALAALPANPRANPGETTPEDAPRPPDVEVTPH